MTIYNLFIDQWNQPPVAFPGNWIIARSMDEAVQTVSRVKPDLIVFGHSYFESDFIDWMVEHGLRAPVEYINEVEGYLHRDKLKSFLER